MTVDDVTKQIDYIKTITRDDESAHSCEDSLYEAVLGAIADGTAENPQEMARLALTTGDLDFARWCA